MYIVIPCSIVWEASITWWVKQGNLVCMLSFSRSRVFLLIDSILDCIPHYFKKTLMMRKKIHLFGFVPFLLHLEPWNHIVQSLAFILCCTWNKDTTEFKKQTCFIFFSTLLYLISKWTSGSINITRQHGGVIMSSSSSLTKRTWKISYYK